jgi:alkylation response protein AidB-like acyl-CoA dehydrogenase
MNNVSTGAAKPVLAAVHDLLPTLKDSVRQADAEGFVPSAAIAALREAGVYRMIVPRELGGDEVDLRTFLDVLETVAEGSAAAGWDIAASAWAGLVALTLPRPGGEQIFSNGPDVAFAGGFAGGGEAVPVEGGFRISGHWHFGSGSTEADWIIAGNCQIPGNDLLFVLAPKAEAVIHVNWDVAGLRGTGSNDFGHTDVYVPAELTGINRRPSPWNGTLYRISTGTIINALHFSAVATGIARRAIDAFRELATLKKPRASTALLQERVQAQEGLARAEFLLESARAYRDTIVDEVWAAADAGIEISVDLRARVRLAGVAATENAARAVDTVFSLAGATAIDNASPISHCFRDIHAVAQNANVAPVFYENIGRVLLGMESGSRSIG